MESAIRELEEQGELDNHNNGPRERGSHQSSDNEEPYDGPADDSINGEKPMQDMDGTINQWQELAALVPGIDPSVAQELAPKAKLPNLGTAQQMRQIDYAVNEAIKKLYQQEIAPIKQMMPKMNKEFRQSREAIQYLSTQIKEIRNDSKSFALDVDSLERVPRAYFKETTMIDGNGPIFGGYGTHNTSPHMTRKKNVLDSNRSEIIRMDNAMMKFHTEDSAKSISRK
ncbi:MAG: hypothetical protein J4F36_13210 [Nitrosopumilaceae archaeon]|nr:hypothetical protein [Nitrosopumilaceae archaeon]